MQTAELARAKAGGRERKGGRDEEGGKTKAKRIVENGQRLGRVSSVAARPLFLLYDSVTKLVLLLQLLLMQLVLCMRSCILVLPLPGANCRCAPTESESIHSLRAVLP